MIGDDSRVTQKIPTCYKFGTKSDKFNSNTLA